MHRHGDDIPVQPDPFPEYGFRGPGITFGAGKMRGLYHIQSRAMVTGTRAYQPNQSPLQNARTKSGSMVLHWITFHRLAYIFEKPPVRKDPDMFPGSGLFLYQPGH